MRQVYKVYLLDKDGAKFFGSGPAELLELVEEKGSLSQAAKSIGMSYTKALRLIHSAERALGTELLDSEAGGISGGKSCLTPEAHRLLTRFRDYEAAVHRASEELFRASFPEWV